MLSSFFLLEPADSVLLLATRHSTGLVVLSLTVAVFASCMALFTVGQAQGANNVHTRRIMLVSGALALGGGVWAMHFIGMLAFDLCAPVRYDYGLTLLSMLPSVLASAAAMSLLTRPRVTRGQLLVGGVLVGSGIGERILKYTTQVRQLEELLPICSYCKKIRDDKNYWQQMEGYINERTGSEFSHSICPDCYQRVIVPELEKLKAQQ